MKWREFLKPNKKKIVAFILLYLLIPYPIIGPDEGLIFLPLGAPLMLVFSVWVLIYFRLPEIYIRDCHDFLMFFLGDILLIIFPFLIYLLSCWIIYLWDKRQARKQEGLPPEKTPVD